MPECSYCGESFDSEAAELQHLRDEHANELSRIDRRRVGDIDDGDSGLPMGPIIIAGVVLIALAVVVYVTVFVGGNSASEPGPVGSAHEHGTMEMVVLGEEVDFSQQRYQVVVDRFHFENNDGEVWHTHATGVTLKWAMDSLPGIEIADGAVTYDGTTYEDGNPDYEVRIEVNGEPVDPAEHVLDGVPDPARASQGDSVRIVVMRTDGSG